jgi:hypothetical protein
LPNLDPFGLLKVLMMRQKNKHDAYIGPATLPVILLV